MNWTGASDTNLTSKATVATTRRLPGDDVPADRFAGSHGPLYPRIGLFAGVEALGSRPLVGESESHM